ncbi:hypothetical protein PYH37_000033 [Sinorhizobium numidicum]|uniref:Uncharacterized protein n=1 Tax=Sinorhizobium numidicum TaxID=680248 RepID=A0ABY8CQ47_9HYPH|nr:hypothetical protein [Sinorhizobium numidicum]WEX74762.1 hypothetical protein PYH37_000033 [Sinorhizobium numidicum]WEX80754.1 hypothetical protein PYH38_000035 [Sinorhizobium numidicum]
MGETSNGHCKWGNWFFDYGVFGTEGLCLVDGFFRGQKMFNKLSLPVIRVKYVKDEFWGGFSSVVGVGCGPYNDQITWDTEDFGENLNPIAGPHHLVKFSTPSGDRYILNDEILVSGTKHLHLAVYARIGAYHIQQSWFINDDGWIHPRIFSKGLSCNLDHWHHPYWRFNFALGIPESHRLSVSREGGPFIADITNEGSLINSTFGELIEYVVTSTQPSLLVGQVERPSRAIIIPPHRDEKKGVVGPTEFSPFDGYVRKFRPEEDASWPHDVHTDIKFNIHEPCNDGDIVFWSICHLKHKESDGADHMHDVGPDILLEPMIVAGVPPEFKREITVKCELHVKDFKLTKKDLWDHKAFSDSVLLDPAALTGEVVRKGNAGDVTGELVVRVTLNPDLSVNVQFTANLFDELERVAQVSGQFNVLRDSDLAWNGIHLVDYHGGDPDTADMSFHVFNNVQQTA